MVEDVDNAQSDVRLSNCSSSASLSPSETVVVDGNACGGEFCNDVTRDKYKKMVHLQSEHKRRAHIQTGFERLKKILPKEYSKPKMSKHDILLSSLRYLDYLESICNPQLNK